MHETALQVDTSNQMHRLEPVFILHNQVTVY